MPEPTRVLLVDAETLLRQCLTAQLNRRRGIRVIAEVATGEEAIEQTRALVPDVVVVDPELPQGGARLVRDLCHTLPNCGVLVLASPAHKDARSALRAGAHGYLSKDCRLEDLVQAIERVHVGELVVGSDVTDTVLQALHNETPRTSGPAGMTAREGEVLQLIVEGRPNAEIARKLGITEHIVKSHLASIMEKLGLDNRVQVATWALHHGFSDGHGSDVTQAES
jgi:DNA-binding NarL/FixJ family response regulator